MARLTADWPKFSGGAAVWSGGLAGDLLRSRYFAAAAESGVISTGGLGPATALGSLSLAAADVSLTPAGIPSGATADGGSLSAGGATITCDGLVPASAVSTVEINPGAVSLGVAPVAPGSSAGVCAVVLGAIDVVPSAAPSGGTVAASLALSGAAHTIVAEAIASTSAAGSAAVTLESVALAPSGVALEASAGSAAVIPGATIIAPESAAGSGGCGVPHIGAGAIALAAGGLASGIGTAPSLTLTPLPAGIVASALPAQGSPGTASIQPLSLDIAPTGVASGASCGGVALAGFPVIAPASLAGAFAAGTATISVFVSLYRVASSAEPRGFIAGRSFALCTAHGTSLPARVVRSTTSERVTITPLARAAS